MCSPHVVLLAPWYAQVSDAVHMLETMHETHVAHLLPRVSACHEAVEAFAANCLACKVGPWGRRVARASCVARQAAHTLSCLLRDRCHSLIQSLIASQ